MDWNVGPLIGPPNFEPWAELLGKRCPPLFFFSLVFDLHLCPIIRLGYICIKGVTILFAPLEHCGGPPLPPPNHWRSGGPAPLHGAELRLNQRLAPQCQLRGPSHPGQGAESRSGRICDLHDLHSFAFINLGRKVAIAIIFFSCIVMQLWWERTQNIFRNYIFKRVSEVPDFFF